MGVTMDYQVRSCSIYSFSQQVTSQEGIYLESLSGNGVFDRSVVKQGESEVGLQMAERDFQTSGEPFSVMNESFHLGLPECASTGSCESPSKPGGPGYSYRFAIHCDSGAIAVQDHNAFFFQHPANQFILIAMIIMVSEHRDYGYSDTVQQCCERKRLVRASVGSQIACQQE
jgi:hypothetical protein